MTPPRRILSPAVAQDADPYSDAAHPFLDWPDLPGTATDADAITPAQYEAGRIMRAAAINPAWNVDLPAPKRRRRKPGTGGRQTREENGIVHYRCSRCHAFKRREEFYAKVEDKHGLQAMCKQCTAIVTSERDQARRAARRARLCEAEQGI